MKLINTLFLLVLISSYTLEAQVISLGGAYIYGDDIKNSGIHLRGYYNTSNERICFGPEFSYFFSTYESKNGEEVKKKLSEINFNGHFIFELGEKWGFYPLTGLNISFEHEGTIAMGVKETTSVSEIGANLGFGFHRLVGNAVLFVEYDHLFSELSQNSYLFGVFFNFGKVDKHEE